MGHARASAGHEVRRAEHTEHASRGPRRARGLHAPARGLTSASREPFSGAPSASHAHTSRPAAGRALPRGLRARLEAAFGAELGDVRVHESAHVLHRGALAFARGEQLHFAPGAYRPHDATGRRLVGHEVAHLLQQRLGRVAVRRGGEAFTESAPLEAEAHRAGDAAALGRDARVAGRTSDRLARGADGRDRGIEGASRAADGPTHGVHDRVHAAAAPTHGVHESAPAVLDATSTPAAPAAAPSQAVLFRVDERGKVHYQADTAFNRWWHRGGDYHQMTNAQFALWKGAGKRHASNKITDPTTGQSYAYNGATGQFHLHDKTMPNNYGAAVSNVGSWWGWGESPNAALQRRLGAGELVDRRRANRTAAPLEPFDVGTYTAPITIGTTTYHPLPTAHGVWAANNDHIVSGQSIRRRAPTLPQAQHNYDRGAVIAIDNPTMHRHISPTYGGRQTTIDTDAAGTAQRVVMDEHNPSRAYARDVFTMLDKTAGLDVSAAGHAVPQPALDLTVPANRLRQMGAYRTHYRLNTKLNQTSPQRGIDPADPAEDYVETPTGGHVGRFTYAPVAGTQGDLITRRFLARLRNEHFATQV